MSFHLSIITDAPWSREQLLANIVEAKGSPMVANNTDPDRPVVGDKDLYCRVRTFTAADDDWLVNSIALRAKFRVMVEFRSDRAFDELLRVAAYLLRNSTGDFALIDPDDFPYFVRKDGRVWLNTHPYGYPAHYTMPELPPHEVINVDINDVMPWHPR